MDRETFGEGTDGSDHPQPLGVAKIVASTGEKLSIQRRRQNWSLIEASTYYRVSISKYAAWELDKHRDQPKVFVGMLSLFELCFLARVRTQTTLEEVSTALCGLATTEIERMEIGKVPCIALVEYWIERGVL